MICNQITLQHKTDNRILIKDFNLIVNPGDKIAFIGEEGNGKSSLLKLMANESLVTDYLSIEGHVDHRKMSVGYLDQDLMVDEGQTCMDFFEALPTFWDLGGGRIMEIAIELGLDHGIFYSDQKVMSLSGGERIRVQLARILMSEPDVFIFDEPSNDLDMHMVEWLEGFISNESRPIVYISHDERLLKNTANRIVHIEQLMRKNLPKVTIFEGGYVDYISQRQQSLLKETRHALNWQKSYEKQQEKFRQIQNRVNHEQASISRKNPHGGQLLKKKMKVVKSMERRFEKESASRPEVPEVEEALTYILNTDNPVARGRTVYHWLVDTPINYGYIQIPSFELRLTGQQKIGIIGDNGVGKSTLLQWMLREIRNHSSLTVGYMPQNYGQVLPLDKTPMEYLSCKSKEEQTRARTYMGSMKLTADEMMHPIYRLSGGQKAKLILLELSLRKSQILFLDEPTRNISPLTQPIIRDAFRRFKGPLVSVSHDREFLDEVCDSIYLLSGEGLQRTDG